MADDSIADVALKGLEQRAAEYRVLYKYQRITEYALDALRNRYLYFSSFKQLNDPFDPFITLIASEVGGLTAAISEKGPKIFCVTEDPNNPLMWAHYANAGASMCVGYAVFTGGLRLFNPVRYVANFVGRLNALDFLMLKSSHWQWELEWRACIPGPDHVYHDLAHPISVCLGPRCSTEDMRRVKAVLPATVRDFEIVFPTIKDAVPHYATYDVDAIVAHYGGIPTLEDLFGVKP